MQTFIALLILLILAIVFFVSVPILNRLIMKKRYAYFYARRVNRISQTNHVKHISGLNLKKYNKDNLGVTHVILGKKYVYLISDFYYSGSLNGEVQNKSWVLKNSKGYNIGYIENLSNNLLAKIGGFSEKFSVNPELIVSIGILNNECNLNVENANSQNTVLVHFSSLKKLLRKIEERNISPLSDELLLNLYNSVLKQNELEKYEEYN